MNTLRTLGPTSVPVERPHRRSRPRRLLRYAIATSLVVSFTGQAGPSHAAADGPTLADPVPADGATGVPTDATLSVGVNGASTDVDVTIRGRERTGGTGEPFSIVVLPDTQKYTTSDDRMAGFYAQRDWILAQRSALNIRAVIHNGDIQNGTGSGEWPRAMDALAPLQRADLPLAIIPGNHDFNWVVGDPGSGAPADVYDQNFPVAPDASSLQRFGWAGGYMGDPNDAVTADQDGGFVDRGWKNNYVLFSASGMDFIIVSIEFNFPYETIQWLDAVLAHYPDRAAIINTHQWLEDDGTASISLNGSSGGAAAAWDEIQDRCNVFLVVGGHNHSKEPGEPDPGEAHRTTQNTCGNDVYMHLADYQDRSNGGDGWLRHLSFVPNDDTITIRTYSPLLDRDEVDGSSQFTHTFDMPPAPGPWQVVGTTTVAGGTGTASVAWEGLSAATEYEWYVEADDGTTVTVTQDARWSFTTQTGPPAPPGGLAVSAAGPTSLDVTWRPATWADSYELAINGATDTPEAATTPHRLSGLATAIEACMQVRALNTYGASDWSAPACGTPQSEPGWTAYIDTRWRSADTTHPHALTFTGLPSSTTTTTLERFSDGSPIDGVQVAFTTTGAFSGASNGAVTAPGTDADEEFGGIVDLVGVYNMYPDDSLDMIFTGLDPSRTYTLVTTTNRGEPDYTDRTSAFGLQGADDFTPASSVGTTADGSGAEVVFSTGANTDTGYVARWTGIDPGSDGMVILTSRFGTSDASSYAPAAVKLLLEDDPTAPPWMPTGLVASVVSATSVGASWDPVPSATSYELAVDGDTDNPLALTDPAHELTGLATGVETCVRVRAVNDNGPSPWTSEACATPRRGLLLQTPTRLVDWRGVAPSVPRCIDVAGLAGVPTGASAVLLNVTTDRPSGPGHVVVYPDTEGNGATRPPAGSTVNFEPGESVANAAFVQVPADGKVCAFTAGAASVRLILDVTGYVLGDDDIITQTPQRLLDTRSGSAHVGSVTGPVAPRTVHTVQITGRAGVPTGADSVLLNVTVVGATAPGNLRVYPGGQSVPNASTVNYAPGQTKANATVVSLPASGTVSFYSDSSRPVEVILDVVGWMPTDQAYVSISPTRVIDTRAATRTGSLVGPLAGGTVHSVDLTGAAGVPAGATGLLLNVTAVAPTSVGNLRVYPDTDGDRGTRPPNASALNYIPGRDIPNLVAVELPTNGHVNFWSDSTGKVNLVIDVVGYVTVPTP